MSVAGWRALITACLIGALVALGGCSAPAGGGSTTSQTAAASSTPSATIDDAARQDAVALMLSARAAALNGRDKAAFAATLADPGSPFGQRQFAAFAAYEQLPITDLRYGTIEVAPALGADRIAAVGQGAWVARVNATYSLTGYDRAKRTFESYFTVVPRDGRWVLADDTDGGTRPQPWDLPGMRVVKNATAIVVGNVAESTLRTHLASATAAIGHVDQVWTHPWSKHLVIVVPSTTAQFGAQLAADPTVVSQIAAVTDGPLSLAGATTVPGGADRIVLNPDAFARLTPIGQRVVLTHESAHVAIREGAVGRVPMWLSEGIADVIGYRSDTTGLPDARIIAPLIEQVRRQGQPTSLPTDTDFDSTQVTIAPAYNQAWIAVTMLLQQFGASRLTDFYLSASSAGPDSAVSSALEAAFAQLGTTRVAFTQAWLVRVRELTN